MPQLLSASCDRRSSQPASELLLFHFTDAAQSPWAQGRAVGVCGNHALACQLPRLSVPEESPKVSCHLFVISAHQRLVTYVAAGFSQPGLC